MDIKFRRVQTQAKVINNSSKGKGSTGEKVFTGKIQEPDSNTVWSSYSNNSKHCLYKMILSYEFICFPTWNHVGNYQSSVHSFFLWKLPFFLYRGGLETNTSKNWTSDLSMVVCQSVFSASTFSLRLVGNLSLSLNLTSFSTDELAGKNCYHNGILKIPLQLLIWQYFFSFSFPDGQSLATSFHLKVSYHMMLTHIFFF